MSSTTGVEIDADDVYFAKDMVIRRKDYANVDEFLYAVQWTTFALREGRAVELPPEVTSLPKAEREEYRVQAGVLFRGVKFELFLDCRIKASHPHIRCSSKLKVNS